MKEHLTAVVHPRCCRGHAEVVALQQLVNLANFPDLTTAFCIILPKVR